MKDALCFMRSASKTNLAKEKSNAFSLCLPSGSRTVCSALVGEDIVSPKVSFRKQTIQFRLQFMPLFSTYNVLPFRKQLEYIPVAAADDRSNRLGNLFYSWFFPHHFGRPKFLSMADNTSDDSPANSPVYTPVAPQFPEQTYRDRTTSPNSDDSEGGPSSNLTSIHMPALKMLTNHRTYS